MDAYRFHQLYKDARHLFYHIYYAFLLCVVEVLCRLQLATVCPFIETVLLLYIYLIFYPKKMYK